MGDHSPHPSARNQIPHVREKPAQMQIPVKEHDAVKGYFKPETADPLTLPGNLHEERRQFAPFEFAQPPARIDISIKRHAPAEDDEKVNIRARGFPAAGE